jgi:RNA polymerase subunit RPABC4/transcription elongation factor Spt4
VPVCLHCGELAPEGALFCAKCGYTLPQADGSPPPPPPSAPIGRPAGPGFAGSPSVGYPPVGAPLSYAAPAPPVPGATGPIAPPPNGKYCTRCRTVIARAAVYCPVCQQPQPP